MFRRWIHSACHRLDVAALYNTTVGIKWFNRPAFHERLDYLARPEILLLAPEQLRLGFDGLKDEFSGLDVPLTLSPHFEFMKQLDKGADGRDSDYVRRLRSGALDTRPARRVTEKHLTARREKFLRVRAEIQDGRGDPIKVICLNDQHFIADGRHRAAVAAVLGKNVLCRDATPGIYDSFYWWVWRKMEKTPAQYQKHIRWFEAAAARRPAP